jgi:hypothetical protein
LVGDGKVDIERTADEEEELMTSLVLLVVDEGSWDERRVKGELERSGSTRERRGRIFALSFLALETHFFKDG